MIFKMCFNLGLKSSMEVLMCSLVKPKPPGMGGCNIITARILKSKLSKDN